MAGRLSRPNAKQARYMPLHRQPFCGSPAFAGFV